MPFSVGCLPKRQLFSDILGAERCSFVICFAFGGGCQVGAILMSIFQLIMNEMNKGSQKVYTLIWVG